ncbi:hypothetical protein [Oceanobacillus kimchii]|uniref:Uncharacterized protein n=1 Tax=Oceanobacillus kimchii TaxID=746691 RepID=A0ABQ5THF0_9BACI|nr:hypothetical protein [Oceanobacillus kimchii]GLO65686.1 hypothetical protein MACH08_14700 [Oceanobacillus kimchii]
MNKKIIHIVNITLGVIIFGGIGIFLAWLYLTFETTDVIPINLPTMIVLFILWLTFYILQLRYPSIKLFLFFFIIEILLLTFIYIQLSGQVSFEIFGNN